MADRIGVIDSGVGGFTVLLPTLSMFPPVDFVYFADAAWCPYGGRDVVQLCARIERIVAWLIEEQQCKLILLACNTATAVAIASLREQYAIPFVGMEPAIKPAAVHSVTGHIGVLATELTLRGDHFKRTLSQHASQVQVHYVAANSLVAFVEKSQFEGVPIQEELKRHLTPLLSYPIDYLVLGCTHFPFLRVTLRELLPPSVTLVDPAQAVARRAHDLYTQSSQSGIEQQLSQPLDSAQSTLTVYSSGADAQRMYTHLQYYSQLLSIALPKVLTFYSGVKIA